MTSRPSDTNKEIDFLRSKKPCQNLTRSIEATLQNSRLSLIEIRQFSVVLFLNGKYVH